MVKSILQGGTFATVNTSVTNYGCLVDEPLWNATESLRQINLRPAGTLSRFSARVSSNGITASTTIRTRVNAANGAQSVSIGSSATGEFTDTTNTDSIAAGDDVNCQIVTGASGTNIQVNIIAVEFEPTDSTKTVTKFGYINVPAFSTSSATRFYPLSGDSTSGNSTESDVDVLVRTAGVLQYFEVRVSANNRPAVSTYRTRVNAANGAQSVSVTGSTTGVFEDTTNTDTIASGDIINTQSVMGTGSGSITVSCIGVSFVTTNTDLALWLTGILTGTSVAASATVYCAVQGDINFLSDSRSQMSYNLDRTVSNLIVQLSSNSITATSTCRFEKNITSTSLSVSIAASTTGYFEDTTNTASFLAGDIPTFKFIGGAGGTSAVVRKIYVQVAPLTSILFERGITESAISVGAVTNAGRQLFAFRTNSESSIGVSDANTRVKTMPRSISESAITVSDGGAAARTKIAPRTISEAAISVSDALARLLIATRVLTGPVTVSETVARTLSAFRTNSESSISVSELVEGHILLTRALSESAITVGAGTVATQQFLFRTINENVPVSEALTRTLFANRSLTESAITVSDGGTVARTRIVPRTITESSISVSESLTRQLIANRILTGPVTVSDALSRLKTIIRIITDPSVSVNEALSRVLIATRVLTGPVTVSDLLVRQANKFRVITESAINVGTGTITLIKGRFIVITEPAITVSDLLQTPGTVFRTISETVTHFHSVLATIPFKVFAEFITDPGYSNPIRIRVTFRSKKNDSSADPTGDQIIYYRYDSFVPEDRPFNLQAFSIRLTQGEISSADLEINDSREVIDDPRKIFYKSIVEIDFKKELGRDWTRIMTGYVRGLSRVRNAYNSLVYKLTIFSKQVHYTERIVNMKRAAKRATVDSTIPLSTDSKMQANNLFREVHTATDILPRRNPTIQVSGEFDLDTGTISEDVTDVLTEFAPGLTTAAETINQICEATGAIWGVDEFGNPYLRYPTEKHSGIILKADPENTDAATNTSIIMGPYGMDDQINVSEGFGNRLYVLNSKDTSSIASSSKASGKISLTIKWLAQSFIADDNNITGAAFILSKIGNPTNTAGTIKGMLRAASQPTGKFPTGATLATFEISFSQLGSSADVIFVNDIQTKPGTIIPGNKYWWVLTGTGLFDENNTVYWHNDNDLSTPDRPPSATGNLIDIDPTKPGVQFNWQVNETGPVFAFSTFASINHTLTQSDAESIGEFGLVESLVNLPAFDSDSTFQKALVKILQNSAKQKRVLDLSKVTIPTAKFFLPGEMITVVDTKSGLKPERITNFEISEVSYNFDVGENAIGCKYCDLRLVGFVDPVLDGYLDNKEC